MFVRTNLPTDVMLASASSPPPDLRTIVKHYEKHRSGYGFRFSISFDSQSRCVYTAIKMARRYDSKIVVTRELCRVQRARSIHTVPPCIKRR